MNLLVAQYQAASQNLPPDARQKGSMPPSFPTSNTPLVYTFSPQKALTVTHHAPPVCTYVTAPPVTKAQEFQCQNFAKRGYQTDSFGKKNEKEVMMLTNRGATSYNRQPPPGYPNSQYYACNNQVTFRSPRPMQNPRNNAPYPNFKKKPPRVFNALCETRTQLFERLNEAGTLYPVEAKTEYFSRVV
ncbi:hypothetical protein H5410_026958 [Solanum commersonii]|uniref:Uncharacterized protein n=1 Tax=Solanum commersonii TaxID=4109 RepID=A0A9J5YYH9_SOLCO|nr:hypothetical protein H5410_026958 [Solanum commersonii]